MDQELKTKWVAALRSGQYGQCRTGHYRDNRGSHCCIDVLAIVTGMSIVETENSIGDITVTAPLIDMNDGARTFAENPKTFAQIADYIEATL